MFSKIYQFLCISVYFCLYLRILSKLTLELSKIYSVRSDQGQHVKIQEF